MRILFDACVPRPLRKHLPDFEVVTANEMGWARLSNGYLLGVAEDEFDVLLTVDRGIRYQQPTHEYRIGVVIVHIPGNNVSFFLPVLDKIIAALTHVKAGEVIVVE